MAVDGSDSGPSSRVGETRRDRQYRWRRDAGLARRFKLTDGRPDRPSQTPKGRRERYARMRKALRLSYTPMPQKGRHRMPARDSRGMFLPASPAGSTPRVMSPAVSTRQTTGPTVSGDRPGR